MTMFEIASAALRSFAGTLGVLYARVGRLSGGAALAVLLIAQGAEAQSTEAIRQQIERDIVEDARKNTPPPPDQVTVNRTRQLRVSARAAVDPCAGRTDGICGTPRWVPSGLSLRGEFSVPGNDRQGNFINYGGGAVAVSEDGNTLYLSCWVNATNTAPIKGTVAKVAIPAIGALGTLVDDCKGLSQNDLVKMSGDPNAYFPFLSGLLEQGGRLVASGMISYDAANITQRNFWSGASPTTLAANGPWRAADAGFSESAPEQVKPGMSRHNIGAIPPALRQYFGGHTAFSTAGYSSIVARSSTSAYAAVFTPGATSDRFQARMVVGCPDAIAKCRTYGTPQSLVTYNGSEQAGGIFVIPGTRTALMPTREALGPTCYGYATRNQADHGKPYLDAVYCYSLSDPPNQKGPMGFPYRLVGKLYDLADWANVYAGKAKPWDAADPYDVITLPGSSDNFAFGYHGTGAWNAVRGEYYLTQELYPNGSGGANIKVIGGFPKEGSAPPPPPPPQPTGTLTASVTTCEAPCSATLTYDFANGTATLDGVAVSAPGTLAKTYATAGAYTHTLIVTGAAGTTPVTRAVTVTVTAQPPPPPPPPPPSCRITTEVTRAPDGSLVLGATTLVCQ